MIKRIMSGLIGAAIFFSMMIKGGTTFKIFILLITLIGLYEFNKTVQKNNFKIVNNTNYIFAIILFLVTIKDTSVVEIVILFYSMILLTLFVFKKELKLEDIAVTLFSGIYIPLSLLHIVLLNDNKLVWLVFITAFGTDTFAYFTGKFYSVYNKNPRKLCPELSPNKTVAGFLGGILGSLILTLLFVNVFSVGNYVSLSILSIVASIMSVVGDLVASKIKRLVNIKDYGNIMPGHGGILDRFDSILFTTPIVYYYITYLL